MLKHGIHEVIQHRQLLLQLWAGLGTRNDSCCPRHAGAPSVGWMDHACCGWVGETAMFACPQDVRQMSGCEIEARWAENS